MNLYKTSRSHFHSPYIHWRWRWSIRWKRKPQKNLQGSTDVAARLSSEMVVSENSARNVPLHFFFLPGKHRVITTVLGNCGCFRGKVDGNYITANSNSFSRYIFLPNWQADLPGVLRPVVVLGLLLRGSWLGEETWAADTFGVPRKCRFKGSRWKKLPCISLYEIWLYDSMTLNKKPLKQLL